MKQHARYGQLILVNSTAADTGEFSCWGQLCDGYICRRDEAKTGSTYIFFTGKLLMHSTLPTSALGPERQCRGSSAALQWLAPHNILLSSAGVDPYANLCLWLDRSFPQSGENLIMMKSLSGLRALTAMVLLLHF